MPRFSANLGLLWPDLPLLDRVGAAARAGFRAVEFHFPYDVPPADLKAACARNGLAVLAINTALGHGPDGHRGLGAVPGKEAEFEGLVGQAIDYAGAIGGTGVHVMAGLVPEPSRSQAAEVFVKNLTAAAKRADALGLTLLLEPLNPRDMPGYFYSTIEAAADIIERVGAPNLKIQFDAYHVGVTQGDVLARLRTHFDRIGHVQIAAVPGRAEPDEGEIDYRVIFDTLDDLGYAGWVGCEYVPRAGTDEGLVWTKRLGVSL